MIRGSTAQNVNPDRKPLAMGHNLLATLMFFSGFLLLPRLLWGGVSVHPVTIETAAPPTGVVLGIYIVKNDGLEPVTVQVEPEPWPPTSSSTTVDWIRFDPKEFSLSPGEQRNIPFRIQVPKTARGELSAQIYFASAVSEGGQLPLKQRFGCVLYVAVMGTEKWRTRVEDFTEKQPLPNERYFEIVLKNEGNTHVRPQGEVRFYGAGNKVLATAPLEGKWPVYPKSSRAYYARVPKNSIPEGPCKVVVEVRYGRGKVSKMSRKKFWLRPPKGSGTPPGKSRA